MTEQQHPHPAEDAPATTATPPAGTLTTLTEDERTDVGSSSSKARRWLAGAMLVTVGLVAGGGTTYAFTTNPSSDLPSTVAGYARAGHGGPVGAPPEGLGEDTLPDPQQDGTGSGAAGSTTGGEPT